MNELAPPLLVFFTSRRSGPARRMESLLAHIARKKRHALEVKRVDIDERPDLAERFRVSEVPALALPLLAARIRRRAPERYAGLRTLARD